MQPTTFASAAWANKGMAGQTFSGVLTGFRLGIPGRGKTGETRHKNRIL